MTNHSFVRVISVALEAWGHPPDATSTAAMPVSAGRRTRRRSADVVAAAGTDGGRSAVGVVAVTGV
jgi:hypothetical protein